MKERDNILVSIFESDVPEYQMIHKNGYIVLDKSDKVSMRPAGGFYKKNAYRIRLITPGKKLLFYTLASLPLGVTKDTNRIFKCVCELPYPMSKDTVSWVNGGIVIDQAIVFKDNYPIEDAVYYAIGRYNVYTERTYRMRGMLRNSQIEEWAIHHNSAKVLKLFDESTSLVLASPYTRFLTYAVELISKRYIDVLEYLLDKAGDIKYDSALGEWSRIYLYNDINYPVWKLFLDHGILTQEEFDEQFA